MRILITNNHLSRLGGSETWTYTVAKELQRRNFEVGVFTCVKGFVSNLLKDVLDDNPKDYDLAIINHNTCIPYVDAKYKIFTCHGIAASIENPIPGANKYVAISEEVKSHLLRKGVESTVILNGIDCKRFCPKKPINNKIKSIFSICKENSVNIFLKNICLKLNIKFNCTKTWEIEKEINKADLVVSLGRGAYEAMACGRSVFIFDKRPYHKIQVGDGIINRKNVNEIQKYNMSGRSFLIEYDENSFIKELEKYDPSQGEFNRAYALENLNVEKQVDKYLELYYAGISNI